MSIHEINDVLHRITILKQCSPSRYCANTKTPRFTNRLHQKGLETIVFMAAELRIEMDACQSQPRAGAPQQSLPALRPSACTSSSLPKTCPIRQLSNLSPYGLQEYHDISQNRVLAAALRLIHNFSEILASEYSSDACLCGQCGCGGSCDGSSG